MTSSQQLLSNVYSAFNRRDIDTVLASFQPDIDWPNAMEGTRVHGHAAVREYWRHQWHSFDPKVEPLSFQERDSGDIDVEVHQIVRNSAGALLADNIVHHIYTFRSGLIQSMTIEDAAPRSAWK